MMARCSRVVIAVAGLAAVGTGCSWAFAAPPPQASLPTIGQFVKIRAPGSPRLGPDGTLYVNDWPDGVRQLYRRAPGAPGSVGIPGSVVAALDGPMEKLTNFEDGLSGYSLSPDGRWIILSAAIGGSEQNDLHLLDVETGAIRTLLSDPEVVYSFNLWLHDSSGFLYTANDDSPRDFHIYRYDLAANTAEKLSAREGAWDVADITRDGKRMLMSRYFSASHAEAYELDLIADEATPLNLTDEPTFNMAAGYMPDERAVFIISDKEDGRRKLYLRDLATRRVTKPFPGLDDYEIEGGAGNEDRSIGAVLYNDGGFRAIKIVRLPSFEPIDVPLGDRGLIGSVDIRGQTMTWTLTNTRSPGVGFVQRLDSRDAPQRLTKAYDQGVNLGAFPIPEVVTYESFDGLEVPALLFLPPGYTGEAPIPFVAWFHGGPEGQARPTFSPLTQFLLSRGFGIIKPNVRGSTGYGRAFHEMDNYTKRWDSVRDGVEAARWLVDNDYARPGRIASFGGSYGGFMAVAAVIEEPQLFGAACDMVGIVNFKTFLEQTKDYRRALREVEYGPLSDPEFLESISPIHRSDEIDVPMFIAHGLNDPRVPVGEAMQLAVELQKRGHDPELLFVPDEGHGFIKLENRLLFAERVYKFLKETIGRQ